MSQKETAEVATEIHPYARSRQGRAAALKGQSRVA
jgi:hypothetical protein